MSYELFIGLRYLRAKRKQAFVSIITFISIAGIFLGVAALIIVLAVMNGFETELRNRILGVNSHIVLMEYGSSIKEYKEVMKKIGEVEGVVASTPFIYSQAMLRRGQSLSGVVLRGLSTESSKKVINLGKMKEGSVDFLSEKGRKKIPLKADVASFPGIVIGKELARNLGPYALKGANFIPTEGMEDERTTAIIFKHPPNDELWEYRYYQGTDPINSETGHSKMSASIWDAYTNTCSSMVFWRVRDYKQCYLQCVLQGLYYDKNNEGGVKELLERNIGQLYYDFQEQIGVSRRLTANSILPPFLQTPTSGWWGISNKTNTAGHISNKIIEMIDAYAENIYIPWFFLQLKTFVQKDLKGSATHRQTRFQAADLKYDYDDGIFSMVFAYINAQSHSRYEPKLINEARKETRKIKYVQNSETGWKLRLAEVDGRGKIIRYIRK